MEYPVLDILTNLKETLTSRSIVILQAPPGAGKSTILPLELMDEPWLKGKKIVMLEPRRLAAKAVATRMASLRNEDAGETVGYSVRFESKVTSRTRLHVVTEGILTRMIQSDNSLEDVGMIIFDEFHERSLQADLALALTLQAQQVLRPELRILIMSATLDSEQLSAKLNAPVITSLGKQFEVERRYVNIDPERPIHTRVAKVIVKAIGESTGDILVFLPGAGEILRTQQLLDEANVGARVHLLYGDLPFKQQQDTLTPDAGGARKVILATSIAETSLTIQGIKVVIDSGYSRVPRYDVRSGLTRLETVRVTRDAAEQRAGRAGRLAPGTCYRLWPEAVQHQLQASRKPEIEEADLAPLMLELFQWGIKNVNELAWITTPPPGAVNQATELLEQLGAVENGTITQRGKEMLKLPTHPRIAHMLLVAKENDHDMVAVAADVAALLEERDPMREGGADLSLRFEALRKHRSGERGNADRNALDRIEKLSMSWRKILGVKPVTGIVADEQVGELVAAAYPERIARQEGKHSERFKLATGRVVRLPANDPLTRESWLAVAHLDPGTGPGRAPGTSPGQVHGSGEGKIFLAAPLNENDLVHLATDHENVRWDNERGMIVGSMDKRVGNLVLSSRPLAKIDRERKTTILCNVIRESGLRMLGWGDDQVQWQARVTSLRKWRGEDWPDVSDDQLLDTLETWLAPYLENVSKRPELEKLDLDVILNSTLDWELQRKLDQLAPSRIEVPSGSMIQLTYSKDGSDPVMEVRLQELFGLLNTPAVNEGRIKILIHLLSPGYKPVQVTQDLRSFWQNTYHEVRKELHRRYPKHSWPEDPWTAKAVRGAKKKGA
ncbi:MAG TPA: ATP-dependent helicase HrpB [Cyclobacteriaceae bacterium]|nr:ATP-dependent helicase HrpB [Cyclobacteriaceae bacterium]